MLLHSNQNVILETGNRNHSSQNNLSIIPETDIPTPSIDNEISTKLPMVPVNDSVIVDPSRDKVVNNGRDTIASATTSKIPQMDFSPQFTSIERK